MNTSKIEAHIERLRAKPEHIRRHIAFWTSLGITLVVFTFWIGSRTGVNESASTTIADAVNRAGTPASSLVASVGSLFGDIKDAIFTPKKVQYSNIEVRAGK